MSLPSSSGDHVQVSGNGHQPWQHEDSKSVEPGMPGSPPCPLPGQRGRHTLPDSKDSADGLSTHGGGTERCSVKSCSLYHVHFHGSPQANPAASGPSLPAAELHEPGLTASAECTLAGKEWSCGAGFGELAPGDSWSGMSTSGILIPTPCSRGCWPPASRLITKAFLPLLAKRVILSVMTKCSKQTKAVVH